MHAATVVIAILGFCFFITVITVVHEVGHYTLARKFGITPAAFAVGFGPEITGYTDQRGTRWKINAFPLGGYVRFKGAMHPGEATRNEKPGPWQVKPWQRIAIFAGGVIANLVFAWILLFGCAMIGQMPVAGHFVEKVSKNSPIAEAKINPGAEVIKVNDRPPPAVITGYLSLEMQGLKSIVLKNPDGSIKRIELHPGTSMTGVGIKFEKTRLPAGDLAQSAYHASAIVTDIMTAQALIVKSIIMRERSYEEISGPAQTAKLSATGIMAGWTASIFIMALLSTAIAFANILPVPGLDGGHIVITMIEQVRGKVLSRNAYAMANLAGVIFIGGLILTGIINDFNALK